MKRTYPVFRRLLAFCCATVMLLGCASLSMLANAEDSLPISIRVQMSKDAYFVTDKAVATVTVRNVSHAVLTDVVIDAVSDRHLLPAGNESNCAIAKLLPGESKTYSFAMVLNRRANGVSFFERVLLFFNQLFKSYRKMVPSVHVEDAALTQTVEFKHGRTDAALEVSAWYTQEQEHHPIRPDVTYLDKYVLDILDTNNYTMQMEMKADGVSLPVTTYVDGDNFAFEMSITQFFAQKMNLPVSLSSVGNIRLVQKNMNSPQPEMYVALSNGYISLTKQDDGAFSDLSGELQTEMNLRDTLQLDRLTYCGITSGVGYVCETYELPGENIVYNFYFAKTDTYEGLVRFDAVDLNTKQVAVSASVQITKGISNSKAFTVSDRELSLDDIEKLFS